MEPGSHASPPGLTSVARPVECDLGMLKRLLDEQSGCLKAANRRILDMFATIAEKLAAQRDVVSGLADLCKEPVEDCRRLQRALFRLWLPVLLQAKAGNGEGEPKARPILAPKVWKIRWQITNSTMCSR
ncbi:PUF3 [Symbiodinium sp. CCMP2456]|nr:PUF3 [Symbiodinium sp. CCMP2456]